MFSVYNSFGTWGDGTYTPALVTPECPATYQLPDFALGEGTPLQKLARIGAGTVMAAVNSVGRSCFMSVDYTVHSEKQAARSTVLGEAPVDKNGLGYDYPDGG